MALIVNFKKYHLGIRFKLGWKAHIKRIEKLVFYICSTTLATLNTSRVLSLITPVPAVQLLQQL